MDFLAQDKLKQDALDAADAAAKAKRTLVGRYITHPFADGAAVYRIVAVSTSKASIEVVDIGDGWVLPAWGRKASIALAKARTMVAQRDALAALFSRTDTWWTNQRIGAVVHYNNGFNQFVRGVIVEHEGEKKMLPTALVGAGWKPWDLAVINSNGQVSYGTHAQDVIAQKVFQPNASNMIEYPDHILRGPDPRTLKALSLAPPAVSEAQKRLAATVVLRNSVLQALNFEYDADPVAHTAAIRAALVKAQGILAEAKLEG